MPACTSCRRDVTGNYRQCPFCGGDLAAPILAAPRAGLPGWVLPVLLVGGLAWALLAWGHRQPSWNGQRLRTTDLHAESRRLPHFRAGKSAGELPAPTKLKYAGMKLVGETDVKWPTAMAFGPDGKLYVAGKLSHAIVALAPNGSASPVAGDEKPGDADGRLADARFNEITDLAFDGPDLYVSESKNACVRRIPPEGRVTTVLGGHLPPPKAVGRQKLLASADAVGFDARHNMYVLDGLSQEVFVRTPAGSVRWRCDIKDSLDCKDMAVRPDGTLYLGNAFRQRLYRALPGEAPTPWITEKDKFFGPRQVVLDPGGHLFLLGNGDRLDAVRPDGTLAKLLRRRRQGLPRDEQPEWGEPTALAAGPNGALYVGTMDGKVWRYE
jgi:hypothetical protein